MSGGVLLAGAGVASEAVFVLLFDNPLLRRSTFGANLRPSAAALVCMCELIDPQLAEAVAEREALMLNGK